ncbi:DNA-binding protein [Cryobacterium sinapicolor]|uniref:DNA-binding protein n=1 Tax=Cryobacterium sinapicolor TaxID=1259236 RepID=A0ABY2J902_9MICO|nr:helix-turn-helix domain-containing protein [Cryobacterium sinapicolor]TFD01325.1 DNA-binding protein [Cryobacterium sinapicolor]
MPPRVTVPNTPPVGAATPPCTLTSVPAGEYLGVARKTLSNWRARGEGPRYARLGKSGSRIVYRVADLEGFVAERMIGGIR